ncbi:lipopolysaccharide transport system permease protein [Lysobacter sp. yr284]|uniref:ABC transporter permease n=1 Tax=Lysobacter sp. yr284 TaxID=1761791 RepID=UPI0008945D55|nr:ABC transporter permease [Lysobacter sp. yr284]SDY61422.1 lipopolysaccharide transport system permease protein [Lysobacter sp. yr284]
MVGMFGAAWRYRGFIASSVVNEFKARFSRSTFGALWIILQPLAQVIIFATILSNVLAARLEGVDSKYAYAIYLMSGILCWSLFAEIMQRLQNVFIDNTTLLKKMQFPRIALPVISVGSSLVNNIALLCVVMVILPILGMYPNSHYLWLPVLIALTVALATGVGLIVGVLNVFVRDVGHVMAVLLQFWFWVTPIIYPIKIVPSGFKASLAFNPVAPLAMAYHDVIVYERAPQQSLVMVAVTAAVLLAIAMFLFRRASAEMVDVL